MTNGKVSVIPAYDAGLLLEPHGASDDWWHDAIREILASAHKHYAGHLAGLFSATAAPPGGEDLSACPIGPGNVSSGDRSVDEPILSAGDDLASTVAAAVMGLEWTRWELYASRPIDEAEADSRYRSIHTVVSVLLGHLGAP